MSSMPLSSARQGPEASHGVSWLCNLGMEGVSSILCSSAEEQKSQKAGAPVRSRRWLIQRPCALTQLRHGAE